MKIHVYLISQLHGKLEQGPGSLPSSQPDRIPATTESIPKACVGKIITYCRKGVGGRRQEKASWSLLLENWIGASKRSEISSFILHISITTFKIYMWSNCTHAQLTTVALCNIHCVRHRCLANLRAIPWPSQLCQWLGTLMLLVPASLAARGGQVTWSGWKCHSPLLPALNIRCLDLHCASCNHEE